MNSVITDMKTILTKLLEHYRISLEDLRERNLPGSFIHLEDPFSDDRFNDVISRIKKAVDEKEKTVIYGDYDVDGLTSTCIMKKTLDKLGLNPGYFIPSRYKEGYGLVKERVRDFKNKGYSLIITVDNGISAFEAIEEAYKLGMEVVIIDHHEIPEKKVLTEHIFHQNISKFISYNCSAASLCLFVSSKLLGYYDEYLATLAGIAVFSDVMPLVGNNLELVKIALSNLKKKLYPNICSLIPYKNSPICYDDINFYIIPSLNSVGRVENDVMATNKACKLLVEDDEKEIQRLAKYVFDINLKRKELIKSAVIDEKLSFDSTHSYSGIIQTSSGLAGLFANKLLREKDKAIMLFALDEKNPECLVGSIRAKKGYDLISFLEKNKKYFIHSGGHKQACGVTILKKDYFQIAILFSTEIEKQALFIKDDDEDDIEIQLSDLNKENYDIYQSFYPFGEGFQACKFKITVAKNDVKVAPSNKVSYVLSKDRTSKVTYFGVPKQLAEEKDMITFIGDFKKEEFNSQISYCLLAGESK